MLYENHNVAGAYLTDCVICTDPELAALILGVGLVALIIVLLSKVT